MSKKVKVVPGCCGSFRVLATDETALAAATLTHELRKKANLPLNDVASARDMDRFSEKEQKSLSWSNFVPSGAHADWVLTSDHWILLLVRGCRH